MKMLHAADFHLRDKDIEEEEKSLRFLIETARTEAVDLVVIAGDTFDSQDVKLDSKAAKLAVRSVSELADIAPVAIIIGTNSHDGKAPEILQFAKGIFPVHVSAIPEQVFFIKDGWAFRESGTGYQPQAVISLIPQPTKQYFQTASGIADSDSEIGNAMSGLFMGFGAQAAEFDCPHILVYHGSISGALLSNNQTLTGKDIEISRDQLALSGAHLVLCGHLHLPQELPGNIFYSGSIYANNWGENHKHGFYIHELDGKTLTASRYIEIPTRKLLRLQHDFVKNPPIEELDVVLYGLSADEIRNAFIRCDFTIYQDEAGKIDREKIESFFLSAGALEVDIRIIRIPRQNVRSEAVLKSETLRDKIQKMAEIKGEEVEWSVLMKAEILESIPPEELIAKITGGEYASQA